MTENYFDSENDKVLLSDLSDVLSDGEVLLRRNSGIDGEIRVKRGGMNEGLVHLIDHRMRERVLNKNVQMDEKLAQKETTAILFLVVNNIDKVPAVKESDGHFAIYCEGIKTVIGKDKNGRYVLTGFDNKQEKQEATESIDAVIARYGKSPEFLGIYAQVGAVIASHKILPQKAELSNDQTIVSKNTYSLLIKNLNQMTGTVNKLKKENMELLEENKKLHRQVNQQKKDSLSYERER